MELFEWVLSTERGHGYLFMLTLSGILLLCCIGLFFCKMEDNRVRYGRKEM